MTEPKIDEAPPPDAGLVSPDTLAVVAAGTSARNREVQIECGQWSMLYRNSLSVDAYREHVNHVAKATAAAELASLRAENAGLREALEASEAERGRLRMQREEVWQRIDLWSDDPDTNLDQLLDVWASHERALAERDAMRAVVDAAVAWREDLGQSKALAAAVDALPSHSTGDGA
jgi:hypothetical protein